MLSLCHCERHCVQFHLLMFIKFKIKITNNFVIQLFGLICNFIIYIFRILNKFIFIILKNNNLISNYQNLINYA